MLYMSPPPKAPIKSYGVDDETCWDSKCFVESSSRKLKKEEGAISGKDESGVDWGGVSSAEGDDAREDVDAEDGEPEFVPKSSVWNISDKSVNGEGEKYWLCW